MCFRVFLILCSVLTCSGSPVEWSSNINNVYKARSIFPFPGGMVTNLVESISSGIQMAIDHCQEVFKWERWNCPESTFTRRSKQPPNKETAFTKAIISAAIVHAVTRNCSKGEIKDCGCDSRIGNPSYVPYTEDNTMNISRTLQEEIEVQETKWSWGGCSDDPKYAIEVAKKLLNGLEKGSDAAVYVARHNNKVGRDIIKDTMTKRCRCHGVSGSCSLQTCWVQVSHFRIIAKKLNEKYIKAVKFTQERVEKAIIPGNSLRDISEEREIRGSEKKLVYLEESPDYCIPNEAEDFPGTKGRICSRNQLEQASISERKSCRKLCRGCGHRVRKLRRK